MWVPETSSLSQDWLVTLLYENSSIVHRLVTIDSPPEPLVNRQVLINRDNPEVAALLSSRVSHIEILKAIALLFINS